MLQRLQRRPARRAPGPLTPVLLAALAAGCRTPEEHRLAADEEVYAIVAARRSELGAEEGFTIDAPLNVLRWRIVAADALGEPLELEPLGFVEALAIAAENSRDYQRRREELYLAALDLTLERWRFSVQEESTVAGSVAGDAGDAEGADTLRRSLVDWFSDMKMIQSGAASVLGRYIGYYEPYATSHEALDNDTAVQDEVRNVARSVARQIRQLRNGQDEPDSGLPEPRPK